MRRLGFTLVEMVVAVAMLAVIAALIVATRNPETANDRERYTTVARELSRLAETIAGSEPFGTAASFRQVVSTYPGTLADLSVPITTAGKNICGVAYSGTTHTPKWINPFFSRVLSPAGYTIASGFVAQNQLVRITAVPVAGGNLAATMAIRMPGVSLRDAQGLELSVEGVTTPTLGILQYAATDPTTLDYYITISGC